MAIAVSLSLSVSFPGVAVAQKHKVTASDAATSDYFGDSVAISGDYAIVGELYDDNDDGNNSGSAYLLAVPEPSSGLLALVGLALLPLWRRNLRRYSC